MARSLQLAPQSSWITIPYWDFLKNNGESETQSGDEIVANIMEKAGLTFGE